ncbi:MAG: FAD-binding protein, partial [Acidimicrobiales bacterium]
RVIFPEPRVGIVEPPFHACRMVEGINFPCGGLRVTAKLHVVDVFGQVIPGLFAVGDCAGGLSATIGLGGMRISGAIVQGRRAGQAIADGMTSTEGALDTAAPGLAAPGPSSAMTIPVVDQ